MGVPEPGVSEHADFRNKTFILVRLCTHMDFHFGGLPVLNEP